MEVVERAGQGCIIEIDAIGCMKCHGDKLWPIFCRVGPSAARMYNLMIAAGFLRGEHVKHHWGSALARAPGIVIISQFDLREVGDEMKDFNAASEHDEDYVEDELVAGKTPAMREERRRCQQNVI